MSDTEFKTQKIGILEHILSRRTFSVDSIVKSTLIHSLRYGSKSSFFVPVQQKKKQVAFNKTLLYFGAEVLSNRNVFCAVTTVINTF